MLQQNFAKALVFPQVPPLGKATRYSLATVQGFTWTNRALLRQSCGDSGTRTSQRCPSSGCRPFKYRNGEDWQFRMCGTSWGASCAFQEFL